MKQQGKGKLSQERWTKPWARLDPGLVDRVVHT